jgi:hypothetical protein
MRYGFACALRHEIHGEVEETFPIGHAPDSVPCWCGSEARRVFEAPHFVEDRRRFVKGSRNAPAENWSWSLGTRMPESRQEMRRVEKERGIEFVTPAEARADAQRLREGKDLAPPPKLEKGWLAKEVAKRGLKIRDSAASPARVLTREESERKLAAERPDWKDSEAAIVAPEKTAPA